MIEIWTDGCCVKRSPPGSKGIGGWAFVAVENGRVIAKASGAEPKTTNNRMELKAAIRGLERFPTGEVMVVSDSKYVVEGAMVWMRKWKLNNWTRGNKNGKRIDVANCKFWKDIDALMQGRNVVFRWVKGHNGSAFNEMADHLAGEAAERIAENVY